MSAATESTQDMESMVRGDSQSGSVPSASGTREVRFEHSQHLGGLFSQLDASLLVSTYQAGKLAVLGSHDEKLTMSFHNFDRPMGVAIHPSTQQLAVAARDKVWFLHNAAEVAPQLEPRGAHARCYLTRSAQITGEIQAHEIAWCDNELWIVNTLFSCLCTLGSDYSFIPRWRPSFISSLAPEDRCHLNGLAMRDGRPKYVTMMAETDTAGGWRPQKAQTGCVMDVETGHCVARGFAMPHSPRWHLGQIWLLDSGRGALVRVDPSSGEVSTVARFPGYTRGLAFVGSFAVVGLSKIRETSTFGGVPIAEHRERLKCGVGIVDVRSGKLMGQFEFTSGVDEIFDVSVIPNACMIEMRGPFASEEGSKAIWTVPAEETNQEE